MTKAENGDHSKIVQMIKTQPYLIGLDGIALSCGESPIFDSGVIVREPDGLMFDPQTQTIYNIEYKTFHTPKNRTHAKTQLRSVEKYLNDIFPRWNVKNLYVTNQYSVEEIR